MIVAKAWRELSARTPRREFAVGLPEKRVELLYEFGRSDLCRPNGVC